MRCSTRAASVMTGGEKCVEAKGLHDLDLVLRHGAERIAGMVGTARRLFAVAVAAQIGGDHGELFRQRRRDRMPRQMIERIAVHQQERRPAAAGDGDDAGAAWS